MVSGISPSYKQKEIAKKPANDDERWEDEPELVAKPKFS
jgi:hypothetical protein